MEHNKKNIIDLINKYVPINKARIVSMAPDCDGPLSDYFNGNDIFAHNGVHWNILGKSICLEWDEDAPYSPSFIILKTKDNHITAKYVRAYKNNDFSKDYSNENLIQALDFIEKDKVDDVQLSFSKNIDNEFEKTDETYIDKDKLIHLISNNNTIILVVRYKPDIDDYVEKINIVAIAKNYFGTNEGMIGIIWSSSKILHGTVTECY